MPILIKYALHIAFLFISFVSFSQNTDQGTKETWKKESKQLKYKKGEKYDGPEDWYGSDPTDMKDQEFTPIFGSGSGGFSPGSGSGSSGSGSGGSGYRRTGGSGGAQYNPQQIQRDRQKRYGGFDRGGGQGTLKYDPKVQRPKQSPPKANRVPPRSIKSSKRSSSSSSSSSSSGGTSSIWKILMYILLLGAICFVVYLIIRNMSPKNQKIVVDVQNEWNPEVISKTELELKLEAAMERGDYRECVRIYFTFILKELIRKGWIRWKKEKTNHHYVMEMGRQENVMSFMECVRIYDLVWYGDYKIDEDIFEMLKPTLERYYKSLDPADE